MSAPIAVTTLFVVQTAARIYAIGLEVAAAVGLPVSSWRAIDPTRSLYKFLATILATWEGVIAEYIRAGFLSTATGDWLTVLAYEVYGVTRVAATAAAPSVTLTNGGGGLYALPAGDLTVKNSVSSKTYHSTTTGPLAGGTTVTFELIADEAGSDSTVGEDEIDALVTTLRGVTITSSGAGVGSDEEEDDALKVRCQASLGPLSPNGARDAYRFVALTPELTGVTEPTKATAVSAATFTPPANDGTLFVYVAGASGAVSAPSLAAVQLAVDRWATPIGFTAEVENADEVGVDVAVTMYVRTAVGLTAAQISAAAEDAIMALFASPVTAPIGGDNGLFAVNQITAACVALYPGQVLRAPVAEPAADVPLDPDEVAVPGDVTVTVVFV